jgi:tol-pal system protein YbgF
VDDLSARLETLGRQGRSTSSAPTPAPNPGVTASPSLAPRATAPPPAPSAPGPTPGARPSTGALQPQDVYQAAYIDFSKGSYALAISGFREFLRRYPDHELAANAQYWIWEAHLAMARGHIDGGQREEATKELQQSVQAFRQVLANYSRSDKAPAALYKEALALIELKQPAVAQARLQYLVENFPQAEETPLARERLAALKER